MARFPVVGGDTNTWGPVLNDLLAIGHNTDGTLKNVLNIYDPQDDAYGNADPLGIADATSAINAAQAAAASAGGGIVMLGIGTFKTSASIVTTADNVLMCGSGWGTVIKPASGAQFDVFSTAIPATQGTAGYVRNSIGIRDLQIDCSNMTGTTAGQGNAIHWYGVRYGLIRNVFVLNCKNWAVLLDGDNTNNFGYNNAIERCIFDGCNADIQAQGCEANDICEVIIKYAGSATAAAQPAFTPRSTAAYQCLLTSGYDLVRGCVFGNLGTYTTEALSITNSGPCRIEGNRFDGVRYQAIHTTAGNHMIIGNQIGNPSSVGSVEGIKLGAGNHTIVGNVFDLTNGSAHYTYCITEAGAYAGNVIAGNNFQPGTSGVLQLNAASTAHAHVNQGYNPVGQVTAPAFPSSTIGVTNTTGSDVTAYIANGTGAITVVQVAGIAGSYVTTGYQIAANGWGMVRIPAGGSVKFTYASGSPSWIWMGE